MINLILAFLLMVFVLWVSKKFYFPTQVAQNPDRYTIITEHVTKRELEQILKNLHRWKKEGKIGRAEYDIVTDVALQELRTLEEKNQGDL